MGLVVDSSAMIHLERAESTLTTVRRQTTEPLLIPTIVWAELLVGVHPAPTQQIHARMRAKVNRIRADGPLRSFDAAIAERYAEVAAALHRRGVPIPRNDQIVVATARELDFGVLVAPSDERHFRRVPGLRVEKLSP